MTISIIVAVSDNGVIGKDNQLIWHLPADLKYFKETTKGHAVIMGRKNYESIPEKYRPLPERINIIVSRNPDYNAPACILVNSIEAAIDEAKKLNINEAFIIGGGEIYRQSMHLADKLYLTRVHGDFDGDTYFDSPGIEEWKLVSSRAYPVDEANKWNHTYKLYIRNKHTTGPFT
jgi:dihydrofolate reductase